MPSATDQPDDRRRSDVASFLVVTVGTLGLQFALLITSVLTARLLGVEGRGEIALVTTISFFASQLTFGGSLPVAMTKTLSERGVAARDGLRPIVRRRWPVLLVPCALAGVWLFFVRGEHDSSAYGVLVITSAITFQTIGFRVLTSALQGEAGHLSQMVFVAILPHLLYAAVLSSAVLADWGWGSSQVLLAFLAVSSLSAIVGFRLLRQPTGLLQDQIPESRVWSDARAAYVGSVRPVDGLGIDRLLVGAIMGVGPLGLYAAALAVASICGFIGVALSSIMLPQVAQASGNPIGQRSAIRRWLVVAAVCTMLAVLVIQVLVVPAIPMVFGEDFSQAEQPARWLVLAAGVLGFRAIIITALQGQGRASGASLIELALTPVMIAGVSTAAAIGSLSGVGMTMTAVGVLGCLMLGSTLGREPRPPSHRMPRRSRRRGEPPRCERRPSSRRRRESGRSS